VSQEFRFLLLCRDRSKDEKGAVTLHDVVNTIVVPNDSFPVDIEMFAMVGAIVMKQMWGKSLDLMAWQLGRGGEREPLVMYRGTPLIVPEEIGATVLPYRLKVPITTPGFYGFDLFDREGIFGKPEELLATYIYGVKGVENAES
jgi:hypothetical protein